MISTRFSNKIFLRICTFLLAFGLLASALSSLPASAATYGCGAYGVSNYQQNCPPSSSSSGGSTPTTTTTTTTQKSTGASVPASSGETPAGIDIDLNSYNEFFADAGITITGLKVGDVIHFCANITRETGSSSTCDPNSPDYHTITVKSIDQSTNSTVLTFASTPKDYTFTKDIPQDIEVTGDSNNDIRATLTALTATTADFNFKNLTKSPAGAVASTALTAATAKKSSKWVLIVSTLVILLAVAWFIMLVAKRRRPKNITF